ncbi:hypothetical protein PQX77_004668 [Marasmius sp. AFHP31]|nr:hypothetical protein PQX77_004668 [Marasmius sp. AFHP31]
MARDRLAAMRAGGGGGYQPRRANPYAQQDGSYEMSDVNTATATNFNGNMAGGDDMSSFYAEVGAILLLIESSRGSPLMGRYPLSKIVCEHSTTTFLASGTCTPVH